MQHPVNYLLQSYFLFIMRVFFRLPFLCLPLIACWLSSCVPSVTTRIDNHRVTSLRKLSSFTIAPAVGNPVYFSPVYQQKADSTISAALEKQGYTQKNSTSDLLVQYVACVKDTRQPMKFSVMRNWWHLHQSRSRKQNQANLFIAISITDRASNILLWQGQAAAASPGALSGNQHVIVETVNQIMHQFYYKPISKKPQPSPANRTIVSASIR
jgi:hypothetical protein